MLAIHAYIVAESPVIETPPLRTSTRTAHTHTLVDVQTSSLVLMVLSHSGSGFRTGDGASPVVKCILLDDVKGAQGQDFELDLLVFTYSHLI